MSTKDIIKMVEELKTLEAMKHELEEDIESLKDGLKGEMKKQNTEELQAGIFKVRYKTVKTNRFDSKAFKQAHADLYSQFTKAMSSKRFSIV